MHRIFRQTPKRESVIMSPLPQAFCFWETPGLGKTHLSLAIAGEVINKGYGVIYGSAQNLLAMAGKREIFLFQSGRGTKLICHWCWNVIC